MTRKADIRKEMALLRRQMSPEQRHAESASILMQVEAMDSFRDASTVLLYHAMPGEVDTLPLLERWHDSKRLVLPRIISPDGMMDLRAYDPAHMKEGPMGIIEPSEECTLVSPEEIDLALVPGVAFTPDGKRLGHGGGFYDRILPQLHCPTVGLAFSWQIKKDVAAEGHDISVDSVIQSCPLEA